MTYIHIHSGSISLGNSQWTWPDWQEPIYMHTGRVCTHVLDIPFVCIYIYIFYHVTRLRIKYRHRHTLVVMYAISSNKHVQHCFFCCCGSLMYRWRPRCQRVWTDQDKLWGTSKTSCLVAVIYWSSTWSGDSLVEVLLGCPAYVSQGSFIGWMHSVALIGGHTLRLYVHIRGSAFWYQSFQ